MSRYLATVCTVVLFGVLVFFLPACRKTPQQISQRVIINGITWYVDVAITPVQIHQGLSGRRELGSNVGMLFIFDRPRILDFWMQGCLIPLDVAFISDQRRIVSIHTMHVEKDLKGKTLYNSKVPALYTLEVSAGSFARSGVKVGDEVCFVGIPSSD